MNASGKFVIDNLNEIEKAIQKAIEQKLYAGIPENKADRKTTETSGYLHEQVNNATLGYIHENGSPGQGIPARPFLSTGLQRSEKEINDFMLKAGRLALNGEIENTIKTLHSLGLLVQNKIRYVFVSNNWKPLKESTLKARKRRKHPHLGERPLIDSGQLRKSITYILRKEK